MMPVRWRVGWLVVWWIMAGSGWLHAAERPEAAGRLIVFVADYCPYCKEFLKVVAPVYPKTDLGGRFPLEVVDHFSPSREWESLAWEIRFYPTFLVMDGQGRELGRFRGYRGEEPFWSEMERIAVRRVATP
ncbi:MAG: thioredoxin family protein [Magnetococcales bacterium]|nr:thioredoxin family protein [Magnetococcales bacterium]